MPINCTPENCIKATITDELRQIMRGPSDYSAALAAALLYSRVTATGNVKVLVASQPAITADADL